ncbi:uncharacterized protein LOC144863707 [Branchiostoma floridae x Branchiostoma japonicum]
MEETRYWDLLIRNREQLVRDLAFDDSIRLHLVDAGILNDARDLDMIDSYQTRYDKVRALLDILPRRGPNAFTAFRDALKDSHPHLARILQDESQEVKGPRVFIIHAGEDKDSFVRPLFTNLLQQGLAVTDIFFNEVSIKPGDNIRERILSTLSSQTLELAVVVVSSSLLSKQYWPKLEFETCLQNRKRMFPIWVDANNDNFKAFSEQVGKYSPTLKQLVARRVQRDNVSDELPGIAAEIIQQLSPLESGVSDPAGSQVPIDLQGPVMTELYIKACREGSLPVHSTRAQVVGQYRSGKTCFINRLMGEPVRLDEPITDGIQITPDVQTKTWKQSRGKEIKWQ